MPELCYSANGEDFYDDMDMVMSDIYVTSYNFTEMRDMEIYVGEKYIPEISPSVLLENMKEYIQDVMYHRVGEYVDCWDLSKSEKLDGKMKEVISEWYNSINFNFFAVNNVKVCKLSDILSDDDIKDYIE